MYLKAEQAASAVIATLWLRSNWLTPRQCTYGYVQATVGELSCRRMHKIVMSFFSQVKKIMNHHHEIKLLLLAIGFDDWIEL